MHQPACTSAYILRVCAQMCAYVAFQHQQAVGVQADRAGQELPGLVAPISRGLNAAVDRLSMLESTCLREGDAIQTPDLEKALARCPSPFAAEALVYVICVFWKLPLGSMTGVNSRTLL